MPNDLNAARQIDDDERPVGHAVETHWGQLPPVEQRVLLLRFYGNMTQADVAQKLGVSQMQVSRHLTNVLGPDGGFILRHAR